MNKSQSKYFNTAVKMDEALLSLLEKKDFEYITIKEICEEAGVNRSTFYLHYENICDLLDESIEYVNDRFFVYMKSESQGDVIKNNNCTLDELMFVTPKYLIPYLKYIKANRRLFRTIIQNSGILKSEETYKKMFKNIFDPVMGRFHFAQQEREYILTFYLHGLIAIVTRWLENDCSDPIEQIIEIMHKCVMAGRNNLENFVVNE